MNACDEFRELISARIDGELTPGEARRLDEHLEACEACRTELAETERVWSALEAMGDPAVPAGLADRVYARAAGARRRVRLLGVPRWGYAVAAVAAALAIAVVIGFNLTGDKTLDADTQQMVKDIDLIQNLDVLEHLDTVEQLGDGVLLLTTDPGKPSGGDS